MRFEEGERRLHLGVRDLVEAGPARGHLKVAAVRSRAARMAAGREVHTDYQASRIAEEGSFSAEVPIKVTLLVRDWECVIRGRLDGLSVENGVPVVEEVKSTTATAEELSGTEAVDWPHWRDQVALYLWLLKASGQGEARGTLVLISLVDGSRHRLPVEVDLRRVERRVKERLEDLLRGREEWMAWKARRRKPGVPFAHEGYRPGQGAMVQEVEDSLARGRLLLLSAPTGTGKTAAVLQGAIRHAYATGGRIFVATAKGTQREMMERTLGAMASEGLPLRSVSLRARERVCLNTEVDCRPEACRFAENHHDKVREASLPDRLLQEGVLSSEAVVAAASAHEVCPHALASEISDRVDVVVGDYNYAFHPQVVLGMFQEDTDWFLVVDEAHNLVERAREYRSASLHAAKGWEAAEWLEDTIGERAAAHKAFCEEVAQLIEDAGDETPGEWETSLPIAPFRRLRERLDTLAVSYLVLRKTVPTEEDLYQQFCRETLRFVEILESAGSETARIYRRDEGGASLRLLCMDPSGWMRSRFSDFVGGVLLSATLKPAEYHVDLLGLGDRATIADFPSHFPVENRGVVLATGVSTAYRDRDAHREATAQLIREVLEATPGNSAVYYSSYAMLRSLCPLAEVEGRQSLVQTRNQDDSARAALVANLVDSEGDKVLHAVLGGVFAEGVDLPEGVLSSVLVVGPAYPQVGLERDFIRRWCEEKYGRGFDYAFLVPGMNRVVQAAGRIIRSQEDRGMVVLVGRRFGWSQSRELLPQEWVSQSSKVPADAVRAFWESTAESG